MLIKYCDQCRSIEGPYGGSWHHLKSTIYTTTCDEPVRRDLSADLCSDRCLKDYLGPEPAKKLLDKVAEKSALNVDSNELT